MSTLEFARVRRWLIGSGSVPGTGSALVPVGSRRVFRDRFLKSWLPEPVPGTGSRGSRSKFPLVPIGSRPPVVPVLPPLRGGTGTGNSEPAKTAEVLGATATSATSRSTICDLSPKTGLSVSHFAVTELGGRRGLVTIGAHSPHAASVRSVSTNGIE